MEFRGPSGLPIVTTEWVGGVSPTFTDEFMLFDNSVEGAQTLTLKQGRFNPGSSAMAQDAGNATTIIIEKRIASNPATAVTIGTLSNSGVSFAAQTSVDFPGTPATIPAGWTIHLRMTFIGTGTDLPPGATFTWKLE